MTLHWTQAQLDALAAKRDKFWRETQSRPIPQREPGRMNKTEVRYGQYLEARKACGEVLDYAFERVSFRLAQKCFYHPDFLVITPERYEIHEVKGHWQEDARVKWKAAAQQNPWFRFYAVQWVKGEWRYEQAPVR